MTLNGYWQDRVTVAIRKEPHYRIKGYAKKNNISIREAVEIAINELTEK